MYRCLAAGMVLLLTIHTSVFSWFLRLGQDFQDYAMEMFRHELSSDTLSLHYMLAEPSAYGIREEEPTLGDFSAEARAEEHTWLASCRDRLDEYLGKKLDKEEQLAAALLSWWVDAQLALEDFYYYQEPLGPALGTQAQLPILLAEYSFRNREDIDTYLKLLAELPDYFMQIARFEEEKSSAGLFMTDETLDQILNQCRSIMEIDNEHFLVTTFAERLEACSFLDADQKISYEVQNLNALNQYFRPAYQQLCLALEKLRGTGVNTGGLYYTPDGISYYEYLLRYSIGTDLSVPVIRRMLEEQIADDYETILFAIHEGADVLNLTRSVPSASSADEILEDLTVRIQDDFPEIPEDISWQVKEVPESLEDWLSPAFYMVPALDQPEENNIYINPSYEPDSKELVTTLAHEGYPGHLYQNTFERAGAYAPIRSMVYVGGYTEGWGLYSEFYAYGFLGLTETEAGFLRALSSLNYAICATLDLAVHTEGWTEEECRNYLSSFGVTDEEQVRALYTDILEEPSNYLKYYLGYLEICRLKESALALSPEISISDFHEWFLTTGPAPFFLLEEQLNLLEISPDLFQGAGEDVHLLSAQPFHDRLNHLFMISGMTPIDLPALLGQREQDDPLVLRTADA